jgi:uncharacterized protein (DUF1015 family)
MVEMQMNPAPILLVHRGHADARTIVQELLATPPDQQFTDRGEQRHRIWAIRDPAQLEALDTALSGSRALIADGHHRYAAYLRLQEQEPGGPCDLGLAMLVDQDDTPLFLGAIHRVLEDVSLTQLTESVERAGATLETVTEQAAIAALGSQDGDHQTLVATDGDAWATVRLTVPRNRAAVEVLHDEVLSGLALEPSRVHYHHTVEDALEQMARARGIALLLPAPDFDLVLRIVATDRLLPEKATSFQPKPHVGVLIRSLRDG